MRLQKNLALLLWLGLSASLYAADMQDAKPLAQLAFRNSGTVRREMQFQYFDQAGFYVEDLEHWNVRCRSKYLYQVAAGKKLDPPTGMRSAVPLGGLGSGTLELRADGSFRDWNIFNNSPAGGPKIQIDDAFFALWAQPQHRPAQAWTLRTHPPLNLPSIAQSEYAGAFPVSRLRFADPGLPVTVTLYAYCEYHPRDARASATPAVIFSFDLNNPTRRPITVSLLFNLPNYTEGRGELGQGLVFRKEGKEPLSGSLAIQAAGEGVVTAAGAHSNLPTLWKEFAATGALSRSGPAGEPPKYGAVTARTVLRPGESRLVTFVLAWYLPHRPHQSQAPGNFYATLFVDATDVAAKVLSRLPSTWAAIAQWQRTVFDNSLPEWLQDALVNSLATMYKTGIWFGDGRWRQWESLSCAGLEPEHIHFYRSLPYAFFFPDLQKHLLATHARFQRGDGFIYEQMTTGCFEPTSELDQPGGREMGDSASDFVLEALQIYAWTGDKHYLDSIWPNVKKAADWQIQRSASHGLPKLLESTYDWWDFPQKELVSYNAFLHLAAMLAAERLASIQGEVELARTYRRAFEIGQQALYEKLWTGRYFRSWWLPNKPYPDALHADTLYGQLWAFLLDLGLTADAHRLQAHLTSESRLNGSPFGLKVMRAAEPEHPEAENAVPAAGNCEPAPRDNIIWQAGSLDWCSLNLYLGGGVGESLSEAEKIVRTWRDKLRDQWDYKDTSAAWSGYPWCNSHYARQVILWAIPLALSGQHYSAPEGRLSFDPRRDAPARLPFFTPTADGILQAVGSGRYRLTLLSGALELRQVRIGKAEITGSFSLRAGQSLLIPTKSKD